jgi:hypothetical protein
MKEEIGTFSIIDGFKTICKTKRIEKLGNRFINSDIRFTGD